MEKENSKDPAPPKPIQHTIVITYIPDTGELGFSVPATSFVTCYGMLAMAEKYLDDMRMSNVRTRPPNQPIVPGVIGPDGKPRIA